MEYKVLLMEESKDFVERLSRALQKNRPSVVVAHADTVQDGIRKLLLSAYDVICLNVGLSESEKALNLFCDLREAKPIRLTFYLLGSAGGRAYLLHRGADVCLTDSLSPEEAAAAVQALFRNLPRSAPGGLIPNLVVHRDLVINPMSRQVTMNGQEVVLTALELNLLYLLASNPGIVFTREHIYERIWKEQTIYGT